MPTARRGFVGQRHRVKQGLNFDFEPRSVEHAAACLKACSLCLAQPYHRLPSARPSATEEKSDFAGGGFGSKLGRLYGRRWRRRRRRWRRRGQRLSAARVRGRVVRLVVVMRSREQLLHGDACLEPMDEMDQRGHQ